MRNQLRTPRRVLVAASIVGLAVAGCSRDTSRYDNDPFGNPFQTRAADATYSTPQNSGAIQSQPLPSPTANPQQPAHSAPPPNYSAAPPRSVPAAPAPAYRPHNASYGPASTGTVASTGQWRWDGGTAITVQTGEDLDTIARRFGVPPHAIVQANNLANANAVYPGQRLVIPTYHSASTYQPSTTYQPAQRTLQPASTPSYTPAPAPSGGYVHVVNPGDTLYSLGRRYGVSHAAIAGANGIHQESLLRVGQRLTIPGYSTNRAAATPAPQAPARRAEAPADAPTQVAATAPQQNAAKATPVEEEPDAVRPLGSSPQFRWPVRGRIISQFGPKANGQHNDGINLAVPEGTEVKAAEGGVVAYAGNELKGYGNLVLIRHSDGWMTAYAHNSELLVKRGDNVRRGQTIARAGQTGGVASPQLHFEIRRGSTPVDPTQYLASL